MKIFVQYEPNESGKGKFLGRLEKAIVELGIEFRYDTHVGCDATISFTRFRKDSGKLPKVLRVDGIHLVVNKKNNWKNKLTRNSIKEADTVIWQTGFCKRMGVGLLGAKPKKEYVINNGADPQEFMVEPIQSPYPKNVIMVAKWLPWILRQHKRLKEMVEIAHIYCEQHRDVGFWICGEHLEPKPKREQIRFLGRLSSVELRKYQAMADVMLNLAYYDWCPNAVVEALVAGIPVICGNGSGVEELVGKDGGIVCDIDHTIPMKMFRTEAPPPIRYDEPLKALDTLLENKRKICKPNLHISNIAIQYKQVFEEVIK